MSTPTEGERVYAIHRENESSISGPASLRDALLAQGWEIVTEAELDAYRGEGR